MNNKIKLKRIAPGCYETADGQWRIHCVVYPHNGARWWYWIAADARTGGDDHFRTKREALEALAAHCQ